MGVTTLNYRKRPARHPAYRAAAIAEQVPIATVADRCYVLTDGSFAAVFRVDGFKYDLASEREMHDQVKALYKVINLLPPGVTLLHLHRINNNVRALLEEHEATLDGEQPYARWLAWDNARRLHEMMRRGELLASENLLVLTYNPDGPIWQRLQNWYEGDRSLKQLQRQVLEGVQKGNVLQRSTAAYSLALAKFEDAISSVVNQISLSGLGPQRLEDQALYELAHEVLNPGDAMRHGCPPIEKPGMGDQFAGLFTRGPLEKEAKKQPALGVVLPVTEREQLATTDWELGSNYVKIGDRYYGSVFVRKLPSAHYPTLALTLAAVPFECTIATSVTMLQKQAELERMWARVRSAKSRAEVAFFGATPDPANREAAQDAERLYMQMSSGEENPLMFRCVISVAGRTKHELNKACDAIIALLREMEGTHGVRTRFETEDAIKCGWPFVLPSSQFALRVITSQAANLMPLFGRWAGSEKAVTLCTDPMRRLVRHDPFPENLLSRNKVVTGMSGSGKSFMQQLVDIQPMAAMRDTEILIVESGASMMLTAELLGGRYVRLGPRSHLKINPFDLPDDFAEMDRAEQEAELRYKYQFIKNLVLAMARIRDAESGQIAENVIGQCVKRTYERHRVPQFRHFYAELGTYENARDARATEMAGRLRTLLVNYTTHENGEEGIYAPYFDVVSNVRIDVPILDFDLMDIKNDPALLTPYSLVVLGNLIYNRLLKRDGRRRLVVVDEAWALMKEDAGEMSPAGQAIELAFREGRKLGASTCFITQNFSDCQADKIGRAVVGNSAIQYFLKHERNGANDRAFMESGFTRAKRDRVYDATTKVGEFSEVLQKEGDAWGMLRVPSRGPRYWLATSHHEEFKIRQRYLDTYGKAGLSREAVMAILAEDYPGGVMAAHGPEMPIQRGIEFGAAWEDHFRRFSERIARGERVPYTFQ